MSYRSQPDAASHRHTPPALTPIAYAAKLALCSLLLASAATLVPAFAQNAAQDAASANVKQYNIPAGSLDQVIGRFGREAGVMVAIDPDLTRDLRSAGLQGSYSVQGALQALLAAHQLEAIHGANGGYRLQRKPLTQDTTLPAVSVIGNLEQETANGPVKGYVAKRSATGAKTDTALIEIPQSISVVTRDRMEDQGVQSVNEALRYTPGVSSYGANNRSDWYTAIRGLFPTMYKDGLQLPTTINLASWMIDPYQLERVEVMRGPASVLYGQGDPGGVINMVSKRPTAQPYREIQMQYGTDARVQTAVDLSGPIDDNGEFSYRLTGLVKQQNIHDNPGTDKRQMLAPSFSWRPNSDTSVTVFASYLRDDISAPDDNFYPAVGTILPNPNGRIPRNVYTGDQNFVKYEKKQYSLGYEFEHRFNDTWKFRQNLSYTNLSLDNNMLYGVGFQPGSLTTIDRDAEIAKFKYDRWAIDNQLQANFVSGDVAHKVLVGLDYQLQNSTKDENYIHTSPLNLYNPVYTPINLSDFNNPSQIKERLQQIGVYVQDQMKFDDRWVLTLNARHDKSKTDTQDILGGTSSSEKDSATTGRAGLVYLAGNGFAPYISYATSFAPQTGYGLDENGKQFKPSKGKQIEMGVKYQPAGSQSFITAAVFQINQTNVMNYARDFTWKQTGEVRSRGIELEALAQVSKRLKLIASYTNQDVRNVKADNDSQGHWPVSIPVPKQIASLWADYTFGDGLSVATGVRYVGSSFGAADNSLSIPSYTVMDAAMHYDYGRWRYAFNVTNLLDKEYISGCYDETRCIYGNPRTAKLTATYRW